MHPIYSLLGLLCISFSTWSAAEDASTRILFGSCNDIRHAQPLWPRVLARQPDVWIWGGDNIYADRFEPWRIFTGEHFFREPDEDYLRSLYDKQLQEPGYAQLRSSVPIVGTWDDHDMGINDADKYFPGKNWSQAAFLDFMQEPLDSPLRSQAGVYTSHIFNFTGGSVHVILLDMRYNRDPYDTPDGDFLGEDQWTWLEQTLSNSTARVHLIVSSLQLLPIVSRKGSENWRRFPKARDRFLRLITDRNLSSPIVISGDVHFAQISKARCTGGNLVEVQSSGMTHSWGTFPPGFENVAILGTALHLFMWLAQMIHPYRYQLRDGVSGKRFDLGMNFGEFEINWEKETLAVRIFGNQEEPTLQHHFDLLDLDMRANGVHSGSERSVCVPYASKDAPIWLEDLAGICIAVIWVTLLLTPVACVAMFFCKACCRQKTKFS